MQGVFDAGLLLFHFDLGGCANLDYCNTAGQFGHALLQLLLIVIRRGVFDLHADLVDPGGDRIVVATTVDDRGVVLVHGYTLGLAEVLEGGGFEIQAHFLGNHRATSQDGNVLQHGLAAITKTRRLAGSNLDDTAHIVDHQGGQGFALHIFRHDYQRLGSLGNLLQ